MKTLLSFFFLCFLLTACSSNRNNSINQEQPETEVQKRSSRKQPVSYDLQWILRTNQTNYEIFGVLQQINYEIFGKASKHHEIFGILQEINCEIFGKTLILE